MIGRAAANARGCGDRAPGVRRAATPARHGASSFSARNSAARPSSLRRHRAAITPRAAADHGRLDDQLLPLPRRTQRSRHNRVVVRDRGRVRRNGGVGVSADGSRSDAPSDVTPANSSSRRSGGPGRHRAAARSDAAPARATGSRRIAWRRVPRRRTTRARTHGRTGRDAWYAIEIDRNPSTNARVLEKTVLLRSQEHLISNRTPRRDSCMARRTISSASRLRLALKTRTSPWRARSGGRAVARCSGAGAQGRSWAEQRPRLPPLAPIWRNASLTLIVAVGNRGKDARRPLDERGETRAPRGNQRRRRAKHGIPTPIATSDRARRRRRRNSAARSLMPARSSWSRPAPGGDRYRRRLRTRSSGMHSRCPRDAVREPCGPAPWGSRASTRRGKCRARPRRWRRTWRARRRPRCPQRLRNVRLRALGDPRRSVQAESGNAKRRARPRGRGPRHRLPHRATATITTSVEAGCS